jgi:DNA invertase Pin-like site-specific DNA recombinase
MTTAMSSGSGAVPATSSNGAAVRGRAFSYVRFSTPAQADGDSLRRQTEAARSYAALNNLDLDEALDLTDRGVSGHYGQNIESGKLRAFLDAVRDGTIPQGSYLLVESLDRISRQAVRKAARTMEDIVEAGINIVDLSDNGKVYSAATLDSDHGMSFLIMALRFMRAHEESVLKGTRVAEVYAQKRRNAAARTENGKPFTKMLPAWLEWRKDTQSTEAIPERADVVRAIFKMANDGLGQHAIAQRLNAGGVPTFGGRGKQRKADAWHRTYIKKLLTNSAVIGTFTPYLRRKNAQGKRSCVPQPPVEDYFPAIIEQELFESVKSRARATAPRGRNAGTEVKSLFAGVLKCVHCGGTVTRMPKGGQVYLVCSKANRKVGCKYQAVHYGDVETALRRNARHVIREAPRGQDTQEIDAEIAELVVHQDVVEEQARQLADEIILLEKGTDIRTQFEENLQLRLREREDTRRRLKELRARREERTKPYVQRRLQALEQALTHEPFNVVEANKVLKEAVSRIVLDPETASLAIHWHHAPEQHTEAGPFYSRHYRGFDEGEDSKGETQ